MVGELFVSQTLRYLQRPTLPSLYGRSIAVALEEVAAAAAGAQH